MQSTDPLFFLWCCMALWFLVPYEWPHAENILFCTSKVQAELIKRKNVSHNLYSQENTPIIAQWICRTNMPLAQLACEYQMRSHFLSIPKLLYSIPPLTTKIKIKGPLMPPRSNDPQLFETISGCLSPVHSRASQSPWLFPAGLWHPVSPACDLADISRLHGVGILCHLWLTLPIWSLWGDMRSVSLHRQLTICYYSKWCVPAHFSEGKH